MDYLIIGKKLRQNIQKAVIYIFGALRPAENKNCGRSVFQLEIFFRPQNFSHEKFFSNRIADNGRLALGKVFRRTGKGHGDPLANFPAQTLALPGTASDSCIIIGMPKILAAKTGGKLSEPPLLKTTSGKSRYIPNTDFTIPGINLTASITLRKKNIFLFSPNKFFELYAVLQKNVFVVRVFRHVDKRKIGDFFLVGHGVKSLGHRNKRIKMPPVPPPVNNIFIG